MSHPRVTNHLSEIRKQKHLTQADLARMVGVARVSINAIERGRFLPTIETALRIAQALQMPVEEIFQLKEEESKL